LCAGARSQGGVNSSSQAQLAVWASSWSLQDVEDGISGRSTAIMERVRKETIQPGSVVQSLVSAGSIRNTRECPVTLFRFPDDEEDFMDSSFSVSYWLVLELFEPETGIGSLMPVYAGADILPHVVVIPCVKDRTTEHEHMRLRADIKSAASLLPLNRSTRTVLCIPACTPATCKVSKYMGRLQHSCCMSHGFPFFCLELHR
jgi:hypothetical protein